MAFSDTLSPREARQRAISDDLLGFDRLARSFLRALARMGPGSVALVQGAPGTGKTEFLRRCVYVLESDREALGPEGQAELTSQPIWYNPWLRSRHGNLFAGFVEAVARGGPALERARDTVVQVTRMRLDGVFEGAGVAGDGDPIEKVRRGFGQVVEMVRGGGRPRPVVFVADLDHLPPAARLGFLEGIRILVGGADVSVVVALGHESGLTAVRSREGNVSDGAALHILSELTDLQIVIPRLDVRRIGGVLRRFLGAGEAVVKRAFGDEAVATIAAAAAHRPLGTPRFLERLAWRSVLLAEFAVETRLTGELSEAQWAWVILSHRWPEFRRLMIRGGAERWQELRDTLAMGGQSPHPGSELERWLREDPILTDFLWLHAEAFTREHEGIYWIEALLLQAGL